jgi:hypothetical protein
MEWRWDWDIKVYSCNCKKCWEEVIVYSPLTTTYVFHMTSRQTVVYMSNEIKRKLWEAIVLVWLMGRIYEVHHWDSPRWHTKFREDWIRNSCTMKVITSSVWEAAMLVWERFMNDATEMAPGGMTHVPSVTKISSSIQALLEEDTCTTI